MMNALVKPLSLERKTGQTAYGTNQYAAPETVFGKIVENQGIVMRSVNEELKLNAVCYLHRNFSANLEDKIDGREVVAFLGNNKYGLS